MWVFSYFLISEAVFGEKLGYFYSLGVVVVMVQKLKKLCNISVITEDIYMKLGVPVHYPKSIPYYQGREFKLFLFSELCPFF